MFYDLNKFCVFEFSRVGDDLVQPTCTSAREEMTPERQQKREYGRE